MASERFLQRCRSGYARLLRLYPHAYRERFGEGMAQTFNDLCRERQKAGTGLVRFALWTFFETSAAILRENTTFIMRRSMNRGSTIFLRLVIAMIALAALAVCAFVLPNIVGQEGARAPKGAYLGYVFLACAYLLSIPFFVALYQAFRLLNYIDRNEGFSTPSVRALRQIKLCALTIGSCMVAGMAALMVLAAGKGEDIAGIIAMGLFMTFGAIVVAAAAAVLQRQAQKAVDLKSDKSPGI